jgi:hypothetical protein
MKVTVSNKNNVGRVTFGKIAKVGTLGLGQLSDVVTTGQQNGDVLVYQANNSTYVFKPIPSLDGGTY